MTNQIGGGAGSSLEALGEFLPAIEAPDFFGGQMVAPPAKWRASNARFEKTPLPYHRSQCHLKVTFGTGTAWRFSVRHTLWINTQAHA